MVYRSLAVLVKHIHVGMGIGIAVKFADIGDISFASEWLFAPTLITVVSPCTVAL
jgi:hypothetical protein